MQGLARALVLVLAAGCAATREPVRSEETAESVAQAAFDITRVTLPAGTLDIVYPLDASAALRAEVTPWITSSARALAAYYGRAPVAHTVVIVQLEPGRGVSDGRTFGDGVATVRLTVGEESSAADLADDWVLVHELVHTAFPDVGRPWAEEGLATWLEPIIRARAGLLPVDEVWRQLIEGLPKGQPTPGDEGLDHTDTWGRRYWGGALYWLLADLEIRKRTGGRRSLDDALRRVVAQGGIVTAEWKLDRVIAEGDRATGVPVLAELRAKLGEAPVTVDLDALFADLGVSLQEGRVIYDDRAPLAAIRRAITAPHAR